MVTPLLEVKQATKVYRGGPLDKRPPVVALQALNLRMADRPARITTIAGESGSGKTTLAHAILGFTELTEGQILFRGCDITALDADERLNYRRNVQAIFQNPYDVYNPFYRVRHVFGQLVRHFKVGAGQSARRDEIEAALNVVGLRGSEVLNKFPHQLSGGQRQRIMMARAYLLRPALIVADEPVSMVDASLRAMILDIMVRLRDRHHISFLYITHDLSTAYQVSDEIHILYRGTLAETGEPTRVIKEPKHPYVQELVRSIPLPDPTTRWQTEVSPTTDDWSREVITTGCTYYHRCPQRMDHCSTRRPALYDTDGPLHRASCFLYAPKEDGK